MTFDIITSGVDTSFSTKLNTNFASGYKQQIINRLNNELLVLGQVPDNPGTGINFYRNITTDPVTDEGYASDLLLYYLEKTGNLTLGLEWDPLKTSTSYVDTTNSTCYYDEKGYVAFCDVLDLFDDASIDSSIWSTATEGTADTETVTETGGNLRLYVQGDNLGTGGCTAISNGASGLDLAGADAEVVLSFTSDFSFVGSENQQGFVKVQLSDGTTHIDLSSVSKSENLNGANPTDVTKNLRIQYDDSADEVFVSTDGEDFGSAIDVSSLGANRYLRFQARYSDDGTAGTSDFATIILYVHGVGYRKNGASAGTAIFQSAAQTVESSDSVISYLHFEDNVKPTSISTAASLDGGTSFSSDEANEAVASVTTGTSLVLKVTGGKPTTITADGSTKHIPVLKGWGVLFE